MRLSRSVIALGAAGLLCAVATPGLAAGAGTGEKGTPQPELKPFTISATSDSSGGTVAVESSGAIVVAYDIKGGANGLTRVCVLDRAGRSCSHTSTLTPLTDDSVSGEPQVFALPNNQVVVLQGACCDSSGNGDVMYTSSDGGDTFGAAVRVGSLSVSSAALVGDDVVFGAGGHDGAEVESVTATAPTIPADVTTVLSPVSYEMAVGSYSGGALVASQATDASDDYGTTVAYAPSGSDFNAASSYAPVGTFDHEALIALSGSALLTQQTTGKDELELRVFNGTGFGAEHVVPGDEAGGGPVGYTVDQDPSGEVHVFADLARDGYNLTESSTTDGSSWTSERYIGDAIDNDYLSVGLDASGAGLILGLNNPATGYPVLGRQGITFALAKSAVKKGMTTKGTGKGSPAATGRTVTLQMERSGLWYSVATTHEKSNGSYSFAVKGAAAGSSKYRAVVSDFAGYLQYGYSAARTLRVTS
jgi:hypothetical protein